VFESHHACTEFTGCSASSVLKWVRLRAAGDAGTWWASPGVRLRSVAVRNREEKTCVEVEAANGGGSRRTGKKKGVSCVKEEEVGAGGFTRVD